MAFFNDHNHTMYSNLRLVDSINKPKDLIDEAIRLGLSGIAITDHEALCCHIEVNQYAKKIHEQYPDFKIALGNEIYLTDTREPRQNYYHFILIAKDALGHKALRILSSKAWYNTYYAAMERVPTLKSELVEVMREYRGHVIATSACIGGELGQNLLHQRLAFKAGLTDPQAEKNICEYMNFCTNVFGDDFYIEVAPGESEEQIYVNQRLWEIAQQYNCKIVPGTDSHYLGKNYRFAHKAYLNSKDGEREVDSFYEYAYLMGEKECRQHLRASFDEDVIDWMFDCTQIMQASIEDYSLEKPQQIPMVEVNPPAPFAWWGPNNDFADDFNNGCYKTLGSLFVSKDPQERQWVNDVWNALEEKIGYWGDHEDYVARLETEAEVIKYIGERLGTCLYAYFNTFKHYIDLFWECGSIVGPGRGSATGFLSNYLLGITQLDPMKWNLPWWRFLNKERAELPDIDIDLAPSVRPLIFEKIRQERGELGCVQVVTFGTEATKSAIQTACRGYRQQDADGKELYPDGIDVDVGTYLSSLIPQERGFLWSLQDCVNGNEDLGRRPVTTLLNEFAKYPGLLEIVQNIEGIVKQRGIHASGVILYDEKTIYDTAAIMRSKEGDLTTCYDLHMCEAAGDTKYDFLVTEVCDKMIQCLNLLRHDGKVPSVTLRELYDKYLHPEHIDTNDPRIWEHLMKGDVLDIFQFNSGVGLAMAKAIKATNPLEMTAANAMIRLMSEAGVESQQDRYIRIRDNGIKMFDAEMHRAQLPDKMIAAMHKYCDTYYGCCAIQEQMMQILMDPDIAGFSLKDANDARKIVAKKQMKRIPELREKVYEAVGENADYIWEVAVRPQLGYAFSLNHSLPYSFVGIQTILLATLFNPVYWNAACLIVNCGAVDPEAKGQTDYGKIAKAVNDIKGRGINVAPIDINISDYGFTPNESTNSIMFGMKGLLNVGEDVVAAIIEHRPYTSFEDFCSRVKLTRQPMISLIKSGAFDKFGERKYVMAQYLWMTCDKKKRITLQNMAGLIRRNMLPEELDPQRRVYEFNRYLKDICGGHGDFYFLDERALNFINHRYPELPMDYIGSCSKWEYMLNVKVWDKVYQKEMDIVREWMKSNQKEALYCLNKAIFEDDWRKYASGNYSSWEMEVMCFYDHEHELAVANRSRYGISNYFQLPEEPIVESLWRGRIPIYRLSRICGTVIAKNKIKSQITLLTVEGVVTVKFTKEYFAMFDRQISQRGADGSKHIVERSWFNRGSMLVVTGMRRGDEFVSKKYSATPGHQLYKIDDIFTNGNLVLRAERAQGESEDGE
jgi:DNA polymerase-3 subunit alpha